MTMFLKWFPKKIILASAMTFMVSPTFASEVSGTLDTDVDAKEIEQKNTGAVFSTNKMELGGASKHSNISGTVKTDINVKNKIKQTNTGGAGVNKMAIGTVKNSNISGSVKTRVNARNIKQGNFLAAGKNNMEIGTVSDSRVSGQVTTDVNVKGDIKQQNNASFGASNDMKIGNVSH